jgi:hypothetical protein
MIADMMAMGHNRTTHRKISSQGVGYHKKGGMGVILRQQVKDLGSTMFMRAIIKREVKDFLSRWNVSNAGSQDFFNHRLWPFSFRVESFLGATDPSTRFGFGDENTSFRKSEFTCL